MTTMWQVHKRWTFTAIGFTPRVKDEYTGIDFHLKSNAEEYCNASSWSDFNPLTQDMTTEFFYIMKVKL